MKSFEATVSSTEVDSHGDHMTRAELEAAAETMNRHVIQMGVEHDPRHAPIGRFVEAWVEDMPDDISVLKARGEMFDGGDTLPDVIDRTIVQHEYSCGTATISFDRSYHNDEDITDIEEIAARFGTRPLFEAKKAAEPLSALTIGAGAFVLGAIASGFFGSIGSDAYTWLKAKLAKLIQNQKNKSNEQILVFEFTVSHDDHQLLIQTIITNPKEVDIDGFLSKAIYDLDAIDSRYFYGGHNLTRLVYYWENGVLTFQYAVRMDGFPVHLRLTDSEQGGSGQPATCPEPE